jgi:hypothetical protein
LPAGRFVGGDYCDTDLPGDQLGLVVADVAARARPPPDGITARVHSRACPASRLRCDQVVRLVNDVPIRPPTLALRHALYAA